MRLAKRGVSGRGSWQCLGTDQRITKPPAKTMAATLRYPPLSPLRLPNSMGLCCPTDSIYLEGTIMSLKSELYDAAKKCSRSTDTLAAKQKTVREFVRLMKLRNIQIRRAAKIRQKFLVMYG